MRETDKDRDNDSLRRSSAERKGAEQRRSERCRAEQNRSMQRKQRDETTSALAQTLMPSSPVGLLREPSGHAMSPLPFAAKPAAMGASSHSQQRHCFPRGSPTYRGRRQQYLGQDRDGPVDASRRPHVQQVDQQNCFADMCWGCQRYGCCSSNLRMRRGLRCKRVMPAMRSPNGTLSKKC